MSISADGAQIKLKGADGQLNPVYPITKVENIIGNVVQSINNQAPDQDGKVTLIIPTIPESLPANGGNAATVNNHSVNADVPEDAVFTDTIYTLPEATTSALGGVKIGSSLTITQGKLDITKQNIIDTLKYTPVSNDAYENNAGVKLYDNGLGDICIVNLKGNSITINNN